VDFWYSLSFFPFSRTKFWSFRSIIIYKILRFYSECLYIISWTMKHIYLLIVLDLSYILICLQLNDFVFNYVVNFWNIMFLFMLYVAFRCHLGWSQNYFWRWILANFLLWEGLVCFLRRENVMTMLCNISIWPVENFLEFTII